MGRRRGGGGQHPPKNIPIQACSSPISSTVLLHWLIDVPLPSTPPSLPISLTRVALVRCPVQSLTIGPRAWHHGCCVLTALGVWVLGHQTPKGCTPFCFLQMLVNFTMACFKGASVPCSSPRASVVLSFAHGRSSPPPAPPSLPPPYTASVPITCTAVWGDLKRAHIRTTEGELCQSLVLLTLGLCAYASCVLLQRVVHEGGLVHLKPAR